MQNPRETSKKYLTNEITLSSPPVRLAETRKSKPRDAHASMGRACWPPKLDTTLPPGLDMVLGQLIRKVGGEVMHDQSCRT